MGTNDTVQTFYDDYAARNFTLMAVVWGVVGMLVGLIIASQLAFPELNLGRVLEGYAHYIQI